MSAKKINKRGITRRDFIKWSAAAGAAGKAVDWAVVGPKAASAKDPVPDRTYRNICPYCSVGCGVKISTRDTATPKANKHDDMEIIDIYGDDTSPLNRGGLCPKGASLFQLADPDGSIGEGMKEPRIKIGDGADGVWYKCNDTSGGNTAVENGWLDIFGLSSWSSNSYADDITKSKWVRVSDGTTTLASDKPAVDFKTLPENMRISRAVTPNSVAFLGSAHLTNEACYVYRKLIAQFGTNNTEHCARL